MRSLLCVLTPPKEWQEVWGMQDHLRKAPPLPVSLPLHPCASSGPISPFSYLAFPTPNLLTPARFKVPKAELTSIILVFHEGPYVWTPYVWTLYVDSRTSGPWSSSAGGNLCSISTFGHNCASDLSIAGWGPKTNQKHI